MKPLALFLLLSASALAQVELSLFSGPASPGANFTSVWNSGVAKDVVLVFGWNSIDTDGIPADFTYSTMDAEINTYISTYTGIKIGLLFAPASDISPNSFTPTYVLSDAGQHTCFCGSYAGTGHGASSCDLASSNTTGVPYPADSKFSTYWNQFETQVVAHLKAASYTSSIRYAVFGEQKGGENYPVCSALMTTLAGGTTAQLETVWNSMNDTLNATYKAANPGFLMLDGVSCIGNGSPSTANNCDLADKEAATHAKYGVGLRFTCVQSSDQSNLAGNAPGCGDWMSNVTQYAVPVDFQDADESSPTVGACSSKTGPLTQMIPFFMQHWGLATTKIYEGLLNDWYGTYASGYTDGSCYPVHCVTGSCPYAPNDAVLKNAALGQPGGTAVFTGRVGGNAAIQ